MSAMTPPARSTGSSRRKGSEGRASPAAIAVAGRSRSLSTLGPQALSVPAALAGGRPFKRRWGREGSGRHRTRPEPAQHDNAAPDGEACRSMHEEPAQHDRARDSRRCCRVMHHPEPQIGPRSHPQPPPSPAPFTEPTARDSRRRRDGPAGRGSTAADARTGCSRPSPPRCRRRFPARRRRSRSRSPRSRRGSPRAALRARETRRRARAACRAL